MSRKRFSSEEISDIVMKLIGEVEPVGETNADNQRYDNLLLLLNTVDILIDEIRFVMPYSEYAERSMKRAGKEAVKWGKEKREWFNEVVGDED